jgi:hypothetical protein
LWFGGHSTDLSTLTPVIVGVGVITDTTADAVSLLVLSCGDAVDADPVRVNAAAGNGHGTATVIVIAADSPAAIDDFEHDTIPPTLLPGFEHDHPDGESIDTNDDCAGIACVTATFAAAAELPLLTVNEYFSGLPARTAGGALSLSMMSVYGASEKLRVVVAPSRTTRFEADSFTNPVADAAAVYVPAARLNE